MCVCWVSGFGPEEVELGQGETRGQDKKGVGIGRGKRGVGKRRPSPAQAVAAPDAGRWALAGGPGSLERGAGGAGNGSSGRRAAPSSPKTLTRHPWKQTPQPRSITDGLMGWELPDCSRGEVASWQEAWNIGTRVSRPGSAQLCHLTVSPLNLDRLRRHRRHEAVFVGLLGRPERPRLSATARSIVTSIISRC